MYLALIQPQMPTTFELLQELDMTMRELQPLLMKQDEQGNFLHQDIALDIPAETIQKLISELKLKRLPA